MVGDTQVPQTKPTFGAFVKGFFYSIGNFCIRYPVAIVFSFILILGAVALDFFGVKIQIGSILGKLFGKKTYDENVILHPPDVRVDNNGQIIPPGTPDPQGYTQPVAVPIQQPSVFSDPNTVTILHDDGSTTTLPLPTGVKNTDVQQVVQVAPNIYQLANNDTGVDTKAIEKDLGI